MYTYERSDIEMNFTDVSQVYLFLYSSAYLFIFLRESAFEKFILE